MGHQSLVYGVIEAPQAPHAYAQSAFAANREVLSSLPSEDDWPCFVREMFAISQTTNVTIDYSFVPIHFAESYKDLEEDWGVWVAKFEKLLSRLYGVAAVVHLDSERLGCHRLEWGATLPVPPQQTCSWLAGPRTESELGVR